MRHISATWRRWSVPRRRNEIVFQEGVRAVDEQVDPPPAHRSGTPGTRPALASLSRRAGAASAPRGAVGRGPDRRRRTRRPHPLRQSAANSRPSSASCPPSTSSGTARRQGGITKAGNGRARRVLVEAAWAYRHPAKASFTSSSASTRCRRPCKISAGRHRCACASAIGASSRAASIPTSSSRPSRAS